MCACECHSCRVLQDFIHHPIAGELLHNGELLQVRGVVVGPARWQRLQVVVMSHIVCYGNLSVCSWPWGFPACMCSSQPT